MTSNYKQNIKYAGLSYIARTFLQIIVRFFFVRNLSIDLLGIESLFANVLAILSLAELGIGAAIVYSLYEPLAKHNYNVVNNIMCLFKKAYRYVGISILITGTLAAPYIGNLIKGDVNIPGLQLIYILFVLNAAMSYFLSYKRNLLIADKKNYIVDKYQSSIQVIISIVQIVVLIVLKNYWLFLMLKLLGTFVENYSISKRCDKEYKLILNQTPCNLDIGIKAEIVRNIKAMFAHKIGGIVVVSTSNIIIAKFIGLQEVAIYSNYALIVVVIERFSQKIYSSITADIGHMMADNNEQKKQETFNNLEFITHWQSMFCAVSMYCLINPFIELWLGKQFLLSQQETVLIVILAYIASMRKTALTFRDAAGLFWKDRYKALAEAVLVITISVYLTQKYGLAGLLTGNIITALLTYFWVEPYIIFKFALQKHMSGYYYSYAKNTIIMICIAFVTKRMYAFFSVGYGLLDFIVGLITCAVIPNIIWACIYRNNIMLKFLQKKLY